MKPVDTLDMSATPGEQLRDGIARNVGATLSLPSAGMQRNHSTRLLAEREDGFIIEAPPEDQDLLDRLIFDRTPIALEMKSGQSMLTLSSPVSERLQNFEISPGTCVMALLVQFPEDIRPIQRRSAYRVLLPEHIGLVLRAWRIPEHSMVLDRPLDVLQLNVAARNIAIGGMGFEMRPTEEKLPALKDDQRLRIQMQHAGKEIIVEGRLRYCRTITETLINGGFSFTKLEHDLAGRQTLSLLTALVGNLQRDEIRRHRRLA